MSLVTSTDHPKFLTKPAGAHRRVLFLPILRRGSDRRLPNCSGFVIRPALCELCRLNFPRVTARYRGDLRRPPAASIQTDPLPDVRHPRRGGGGTASRRARRPASRFARRQHPGPRRSSGALQPVHRVGRRRQAVRLLVGPNGRTMPTPEDGPARQVTERIYVEITNALRAAGSALDVLGGLTVPFLGLPVSPHSLTPAGSCGASPCRQVDRRKIVVISALDQRRVMRHFPHGANPTSATQRAS